MAKKKEKEGIENIESAATWETCPICGEKAFEWVYMLHSTLGCERAKRYN